MSLAVLLSGVATARGDKIRPEPSTPGPKQGTTATRWLAPFVRESIERVVARDSASYCCGPGQSTFRWYRADGTIEYEVKDTGASSGFGYVRKTSNGLEHFYGLRPIWFLSYSRTNPPGSVTASPSGNICVVQTFPDSTHVSLDVYRNGDFVRALGPYPSFRRSERVLVESWGSVAIPISFDRGDDRISAVLYGRDGEFFITVPTTTDEAHASPSGRRAVFQWQSAMAIVDIDGHRVDVRDLTQPRVIHWSADEAVIVVLSGGRGKQQCTAMETATGRVRWESLVGGESSWESPAAALDDLILVASTDVVATSRDRACVTALDVQTGNEKGGTVGSPGDSAIDESREAIKFP